MLKAKEILKELSNFNCQQEELSDSWWEEQKKLFEADPSLQPPKKWWDEMVSQGKSPELVSWIWYHKLSPRKRAQIRHREGKKYGKTS